MIFCGGSKALSFTASESEEAQEHVNSSSLALYA
jgi:hypothetical protein